MRAYITETCLIIRLFIMLKYYVKISSVNLTTGHVSPLGEAMKEAVDSFLNFLAVEKGYSVHTIAAYRNDLTGLTEFAGREIAKQGAAISWPGFSRQNMLAYMLDLKERGYVATTVARKVA